jgi:uncharacterized protein YndB with AHSA1/START domain
MATAEPPVDQDWTVLQVKRTFDASRERVFEAWIDPEQLRRWLTGWTATSPGAEADARVGGEFRISMKARTAPLLARLPGRDSGVVHMIGRYVEIQPPERLVFTLGWEDFPLLHMDREASQVTVEFHERNGRTEVVLTHERQPNRRVRALHKIGWIASLRNLDKLLRGKGKPVR